MRAILALCCLAFVSASYAHPQYSDDREPAFYRYGHCFYPRNYQPGDFNPRVHHLGFNRFDHKEWVNTLSVEYYCEKP